MESFSKIVTLIEWKPLPGDPSISPKLQTHYHATIPEVIVPHIVAPKRPALFLEESLENDLYFYNKKAKREYASTLRSFFLDHLSFRESNRIVFFAIKPIIIFAAQVLQRVESHKNIGFEMYFCDPVKGPDEYYLSVTKQEQTLLVFHKIGILPVVIM